MDSKKLIIEQLADKPAEGENLFRYVTIDKLMDFLLNERLPLTRLNLFEDKLEGITTNHILLNLTSDKLASDVAPFAGGLVQLIGENFTINPTKRNNLRRQRVSFQKFNFANCWFRSDHESIAMWQLYSRPDSVAIKIDSHALVKEITENEFELSTRSFKKIRLGNVKYYRFNDLDSIQEAVKNQATEDTQGFVKDKSFSHEQEFRIILSVEEKERPKAKRKKMILDEKIEELNDSIDQKVVYLKFKNFQNMPFELIFHPRVSEWHKKNVSDFIQKYNLKFNAHESSLKRIFK